MIRASATAKINLALVVGPIRPDGKHEVATVLQRIDLADRLELRPSATLQIEGFASDTLVRRALESVAQEARVPSAWHARIEKKIPVAAGLGGGSADAAAALRLASEALDSPLDGSVVHRLACALGADVPFFLADGPQLGTGNGTDLTALELPQDFWIVLVLPNDVLKASTGAVYAQFDARSGADGFAARRDELLAALARVTRAADLAALPRNDLASSPFADDLLALGAFRADVSGAGPAVYGLFARERDAAHAAASLRRSGRTWITAPAWYG